MKPYIFTSERLGFRTWTDTDREPFFEMCNDSEVMEFFPKLMSREELDEFMVKIKAQYDDHGICFYATDLLETGEFCGFIGLIKTPFKSHFTPSIEIGWRLKRSVWNQGLATEGALASLKHGFEELGFDEIVSFTPELNKKSEKVMQKIGMNKIGEFGHPSIQKDHRLYKHVLYSIKNPKA